MYESLLVNRDVLLPSCEIKLICKKPQCNKLPSRDGLELPQHSALIVPSGVTGRSSDHSCHSNRDNSLSPGAQSTGKVSWPKDCGINEFVRVLL
jgi:hypothetical protein